MPGATDIIDAMVGDSKDNFLMMKGQAALYSSQGLLNGMLTLYRDRLVWNEVSKRSSNMLTISMSVMFGATLSPEGKYKFKSFEAASATNLKIEASSHFTVYTIMARESAKRPLCDTWTFMVESQEDSATWVSLLRLAIRPQLTDETANALVFLNPVSGKRKSLKVFESIVKPILEIGSMPYSLKITDSPRHAADFVENGDLSLYTSIVTVSGDGLLHEVLNGLLRRKDWAQYKRLPLGVIPTGTGNGLAKSIDCLWPEQAAVAVVKAETRPLDVMSVTTASGLVEHCFLSMTWGLIADIDIESERMRWAGSARLDLYGTIRLMNLRYYGGRLHYLPATPENEDAEADGGGEGGQAAAGNSGTAHDAVQRGRRVGGPDSALAATQHSSTNSSVANIMERADQGADVPWGLPAPNFSSPLIRHSPKPLASPLLSHAQPAVTLHPTLTAGIGLPVANGSLPPRWKTIEGPFAQVIATNVPWLSAGFLACQKARISDGAIDLVFSRAVTKWQILPYISSSTKDNYMNKDGVEHTKVRAFILEPTGLRTTTRSEASFATVQGKGDSGSLAKTRPLSVPLFASLRTRSLGRTAPAAAATEGKNASPQAPVPVRVRSQAYATYHHHSHRAGGSSSLLVGGLASPQPPGAEATPDAEKMRDDAGSRTAAAPRPPVQAVFSVRSETELAALNVERRLGSVGLGSPSPHGSLAAASSVPKSAAGGGDPGGAWGATGTKPAAAPVVAEPVTTTVPASGTFVDAASKASGGGCRLVGNHGIVDLDGEVVELGPIKVECLPSLVSVVCPPWLNEMHLSRVSSMPATKPPDDPIKGSLSREGSVLSFNNV
ncbi:Sphingosine kinase 1 [Coemansia sp. RSA 1939]|nr:Sphingosine kinase 1 [Coemansia sp. RSA 1939]